MLLIVANTWTGLFLEKLISDLKGKGIPFMGRYLTWMDYNFFPFIVLKGEPLLDFK